MISEFMYERIRQTVHARELDLLRVKGKEKTVRVYELQGVNEQQPSESVERWYAIINKDLLPTGEKTGKRQWPVLSVLYNMFPWIDRPFSILNAANRCRRFRRRRIGTASISCGQNEVLFNENHIPQCSFSLDIHALFLFLHTSICKRHGRGDLSRGSCL